MKDNKMNPGEKYLTISLFGGEINLRAFPNKEPRSTNSPKFIGNGVAVWVNKKRDENVEPSEDL